MLDTGCQLISVFNEDMNATRKLTSVILTKGGLKKVAFKRLSPVYVSMGYGATNTLFESLLGKGLTKYSSTGKAKWTKEYRGSNLSCKDWRLLQGMMELSLSDKVLKDWKSQVEEGVQKDTIYRESKKLTEFNRMAVNRLKDHTGGKKHSARVR